MPNESTSIDLQRLLAEVAARHNLFLKPDDPAVALVTMNQLILECTTEVLHQQVRANDRRIQRIDGKAETRAANIMAQKVKESAVEMRRGLQSDIQIAGLKAREIAQMVDGAHAGPL